MARRSRSGGPTRGRKAALQDAGRAGGEGGSPPGLKPLAEAADPFATVEPAPARGGPPMETGTPAFPIPGWERYQPLRFLGQGGMGRVFLARDPRVSREVAIKLVRGDDPELMRRLVGEARAQARVDHPRVCKVFEVGEVAGHVYIAMQRIDGEPLGALAPELNVAEKAMIVREAALGAHEAHRAGIVHRDLKPSNILVERDEDGSLRPFVMDFGLARSMSDGATVTACAVGTPHYMSPEQARGDAKKLDRRADVYSLGATLYHVLTGEPPIGGDNPLDVLHNVATVEPRPLRTLDPSIPADLEAIALRCLEKDPSARYDSARALAEDLDRFLNGEAVKARPAGPFDRARRYIRKHRRLSATMAAGLATVLLALGWGIQARASAAEREQRARRIAATVEHIEAMALYSALSPLHDVRPDRHRIRAEMDVLERELSVSDPAAAGPAHHALGRGFLALGDEVRARGHLEAAWGGGDREPAVAFSLAIVLGNLYQQARLEAERVRDAAQREARKRDIERRYRDPALGYLKHAGGGGAPSPRYVEALLASYEDRLDDALGHLDSMEETLPWFHEARKLRGDLLSLRASRRWNAGDRAGAIADFEAGRRAYDRAAAIGESVPAVHAATAQIEYGLIVMELYSTGHVDPAFERGLAAARRALAADPDHVEALVLEARFHRRMAEHLGNRGTDAQVSIQAAVAAAERAVAAAPEDPAARTELALDHWQSGQLRSERGQDPREPLRRAAGIFEGFRPEDRDYDYHLNVGLIFDVWADHEARAGGDPMPTRSSSIEAYRTATELDGQPFFGWLNLGNAYLLRAAHPRCSDPDGDLAQAMAALEKALARNPEHTVAHHYKGEAHSLAASRARARGGDARPHLARALEHYREGLGIDPRHAYLHNGAGNALVDLAREAWDRGEDPRPWMREAQAAFEQLMTVAPEQGFGAHNLGDALVVEMEYELESGRDPRGPAARAIPAIEKAVAQLPDMAPPHANLGKVHALLARFELEQRRDPEKALSRAFAALGDALRRNPEDRQSHLYLGEARAIRALHRARTGRGAAADFQEPARAYEKALDVAPEDQGTKIAFGHFWRARAEVDMAAGRDPGPALQRGLTLVESVLAVRPDWATARVLRASLRLVQARQAAGEERRALGRRAAEDFRAALATNPNLSPRWKDQATIAGELSVAP